MPRTAIAITDVTAQPPSVSLLTVAADSVNNNMFLNDGRTILTVSNPTGGALSVTVVSVADRFGRVGDLVVSIPANTTKIFGPFIQSVWSQSGADIGNVYVNPASASLGVAAFRLAATGASV
jgi:hypothetical protein